jgi:hypothetical protein
VTNRIITRLEVSSLSKTDVAYYQPSIEEAAAARGKKVEVFLAELLDEARNPRPNSRYY